MIRIILSFIIYTIIGRWVYSELRLLTPHLIPSINQALTKFSIPTHDHWGSVAFTLKKKYEQVSSDRSINLTSVFNSNSSNIGAHASVEQDQYQRNIHLYNNDKRNYGEFGYSEFHVPTNF